MYNSPLCSAAENTTTKKFVLFTEQRVVTWNSGTECTVKVTNKGFLMTLVVSHRDSSEILEQDFLFFFC